MGVLAVTGTEGTSATVKVVTVPAPLLIIVVENV
jgi:hypothetical protein